MTFLPRMTAQAPCKTCSRLYRANRVRCARCGYWKKAA